jgi:competence protein ComEA
LPTPTPTPTPAAAANAATVAGALVVVDVAGRVRRPGIVELPAGSRVVDALRAAGGARHGVDTSTLNLARLLVDGEQIVVGLDVPASSAVASPMPTAAGPVASVNLNTATLEQLDTLPGIGPVTAQAILDWRTENGSFTSVDELLEVSGIGDATLADIEAYVYV